MRRIQFNDLYSQYLQCKDAIDSGISRVIENSSFVRGKEVEEFELAFAKITCRNNTISCANGTDAIFACLKALEIMPGDEVIVPAHSWISTSEVVTQAGGVVVFAEVDPSSYTIDPESINERITGRTVGIIPVHLYGHPADMDPIMAIARKHGLWVIEDCAQAHLAKYKNNQVGSFGVAATYSFYPGKNLGAFGDAGAITTDSSELATKLTRYCRHGGLFKGEHLMEGINSRMDTLQAVVLSAKLQYLEEWTKKRRVISEWYADALSLIPGIVTPIVSEGCTHVWHLYVVRVDKRDELKGFLHQKGIPALVNYPISLPFLPAYSYQKNKEADFPVSSSNQQRILSLPMHPFLSSDDIGYIHDSIVSFYS